MSSQSKDNTCPVCGGKGYRINGIDPRANIICSACLGIGSGQQEDNTGHPTAETPDAQPFDNVSESSRTPGEVGNLYGVKVLPETIEEWEEYAEDLITENERLRGIIERIISGENKPTEPSEQEDKPTKAETQAMVDEYSNLGRRLTDTGLPPAQIKEIDKRRAQLLEDMGFDSKPEKPHEHQWQTRSNGTFCLGCGGIKLPEDEPSKPDQPHMSDQLRPLLWNLRLNPNQPHIITDTQLAIEALLATEYDRGVKDSYKSIQADFDQGLKDEYDRGKVETLEYLAKAGNEFTAKTGSLEAGYAHIRDLIQDGLKSKGESK